MPDFLPDDDCQMMIAGGLLPDCQIGICNKHLNNHILKIIIEK